MCIALKLNKAKKKKKKKKNRANRKLGPERELGDLIKEKCKSTNRARD